MNWRALRRLGHRVRRASQVGWRERLLLSEATLRLIEARVALAVVPFPRLAKGMGGFVAADQARARAAANPPSAAQRAIAGQVGWAVTRAATHVPFAAVCLPQAMAARTMLQKRGIVAVIHFGTKQGATTGLDAHAWVDVGAVEVTGYPIAEGFTEIACLG